MLPRAASKQEWESFIENCFSQNKHPAVVLGTLLTMHLVQVVLCVPFVHITQILYAYIYGFFVGTLVSFVWESLIVTVYTSVVHQRTTYDDRDMASIVNYLQQQNVVTFFTILLQSSSIPLNAQILVIGYGNTTVRSFLRVFYGVSLFNTTKNCLVGELIKTWNMDSETNVHILSVAILLITTIPTLVSFFIWNGTYNFYNTAIVHNASETPESDELKDIESDLSVKVHSLQCSNIVSSETHPPFDNTTLHSMSTPNHGHEDTPTQTNTENENTVETDSHPFIPIVPWTAYFFSVHPDVALKYCLHHIVPPRKNQNEDEEILLTTPHVLNQTTGKEPELPNNVGSTAATDTSPAQRSGLTK